MDDIQDLRKRLERGNTRSIIVPHISADGDAVGACSALYGVLTKAGIKCDIICPDNFPEYLMWLPNADKAIPFRRNMSLCKQLIQEADIVFMLDHNNFNREGEMGKLVEVSYTDKIIIDHHPEPIDAEYLFSDTSVSSTCELLFTLINQVWGKEMIDTDIANAIYTGINTDTGGFSHNSSNPQTYRIVAELLEAGLEKDYVYEKIYQNNTLSRLRLLGHALLQRLHIHPDFPVAIIPITFQEMEDFDYKEGDLEGLVNIPLSIAYVQVAVLITQRKEQVKLSFRSKGEIPVNTWAAEYFNGGGHFNAAGGQMQLSFEEVVEKVYKTADFLFPSKH
ncbi:MAG: DHH family phosphoesterase [Culturomica sp.]|jgi:phosphoesterase RecJ-like protein|nr:DHH family phosphoesterase [Culturomica sp.]